MAAPAEDDTLNLELTKKKKKKKPVNLDELISSQDSAEPQPQQDEKPAEEVDDLSFTSMKKKKKKKKYNLDDADGDKPAEQGEQNGNQKLDDDDDTLDLSQMKKPKKHRQEVSFAADLTQEDKSKDNVHIIPGDSTWSGTDRDYTYDELLARVFDIMRKKNPEMVAGEKKRFIMKPPQCARVGTRKTSFVNFTEICAVLKRQPKHCLSFILAELGTSGSVDGNNQLIIKGRFQQKQLESVLRSYIKEYVTCHTCRSPDTALERQDRLYFLRCNVCQSRCSVASIKSGFQALTGRRARIRAKQV